MNLRNSFIKSKSKEELEIALINVLDYIDNTSGDVYYAELDEYNNEDIVFDVDGESIFSKE